MYSLVKDRYSTCVPKNIHCYFYSKCSLNMRYLILTEEGISSPQGDASMLRFSTGHANKSHAEMENPEEYSQFGRAKENCFPEPIEFLLSPGWALTLPPDGSRLFLWACTIFPYPLSILLDVCQALSYVTSSICHLSLIRNVRMRGQIRLGNWKILTKCSIAFIADVNKKLALNCA